MLTILGLERVPPADCRVTTAGEQEISKLKDTWKINEMLQNEDEGNMYMCMRMRVICLLRPQLELGKLSRKHTKYQA